MENTINVEKCSLAASLHYRRKKRKQKRSLGKFPRFHLAREKSHLSLLRKRSKNYKKTAKGESSMKPTMHWKKWLKARRNVQLHFGNIVFANFLSVN